ncbi:MAG: PTS sugar transporter subunit IIA [candidate division KSB1 bacterium]|nr:PTS sugar transporter subunit IIA [candidate division KSB1 bacterium]
MSLLDILTKEVIAVPLKAQYKNEAIRELIELLKNDGQISDAEQVYDDVMTREDKASTGLEKGIAVPHAKTGAAEKLTAAIGIAPDGIDFGSMDNTPSKLIFLVIAPPASSGAHIALLSEIARLSQYQSLCDELAKADSPEQVLSILQGED